MPTVVSHGLISGTSPFSTTVTASGSNLLLVCWLAFPTGGGGGGVVNGLAYNGVALPLRWLNFAASPSNQSSELVLGYTTNVVPSATLTADSRPLDSGIVILGWAVFSNVHQVSPLHWGIISSGFVTHYGIGIPSTALNSSYVSSSDLVYGICWLYAHPSSNIPDTGVTDLDGTVLGATIPLTGAVNNAVHGVLTGTNDNAWGLTWHQSSGLSSPNYSSAGVIVRDVSATLPIRAAGTYAFGKQDRGVFGTLYPVRVFPWGDNFSRWADPKLLPKTFRFASSNGRATNSLNRNSAVGIAVGSDDGYPYTWGDDDWGIRGDGTTGSPSSVPIKLTNYPNTTDACAGLGSLFWISNGVLHAVGLNSNGEFANGTTLANATATAITLPAGSAPKKIRAGDGYAVLLDTAGRAWWSGGITGTNTFWTRIGTYSPYTEIDAGEGFALLLRSDGLVDEFTGSSIVTTFGVVNAIDVCAYGLSGAILTSDPQIYTFGDNLNGQLGRGGSAQPPQPVTSLVGSRPVALAKRGYASHNLLWVSADKKLYGCGETAAGRQIDPFIDASMGLGGSFDSTPGLVLSDRLGVNVSWCTGSGVGPDGVGIIAGFAPQHRAFPQVIG